MVDGLEGGDRGYLCELWYQSRYAKNAKHHVEARVARTGKQDGQWESREIDLVDDNRAIEVKDVTGKIEKDQFEAYLDMARGRQVVSGAAGPTAIKRVTYVFTHPEGARANLPFLAEQLKDPNIERILSIEAFDTTGTRHVLRTHEDAVALVTRLGEAP